MGTTGTRRTPAGLVAALLLVGAAAGAGCASDAGYIGAASGPRVAAIGDSVMVQASPELRRRLRPGHGLWIAAMAGSTFPAAEAPLAVMLGQGSPDVLLVNLGSNDVTVSSEAVALSTVDRFLAAVPPSVCVVLATPSPRAQPVFRMPSRSFRDALGERADVVLPWADAVTADASLVSPVDGVHLTPAGAARYGELAEEAIGRCPG